MSRARTGIGALAAAGGVLLLLTVMGSPPAHAKQKSPKPVVLLLLDSSASMEFSIDELTEEGHVPDCTDSKQAGFSYKRSRWITALEVLTGTFDGYWCSYDDRTTPTDREDYLYQNGKLPHVVPHGAAGGGVEQKEDGLLDLYRDDIKFGAMTCDVLSDPGKAQSGCYSYGPNKDWSGNTYNLGARNENAPWGALVTPSKNDNLPQIRAHNDEIQKQLLLATPWGPTPLAAMLEDALYFFENDDSVKPFSPGTGKGDKYYDCRPKSVILVSDTSEPVAEGKNGYMYSHAAAAKLLEKGIKVYVVAFKMPETAFPVCDKIAKAGGTDSAYVVTNQAEMVTTLGEILQKIQGNVPSRVHTVVTNRTMSTVDMQYQFNASFSGSPYCALDEVGHLDQLVYGCDPACRTEDVWESGAALCSVFSLADALNSQPERKIWTQIDGGLTPFVLENSDLTPNLFDVPTSGPLPKLDPDYLSCGKAVCSASSIGEATNEANRVEYRNQLIRLTAALSGSRRADVRLGAIYHSEPVLQPNLWSVNAAIPSFIAYRNQEEIRNRPTALFVGTHDGLLHAFRVDRAADLPQDEWGREMWAFLPNTLLPKLNLLAAGDAYLMDGSPVVQEVRLGKDAPLLPIDEEIAAWHSVLVAGYRQGGRGYFALDVTDPAEPKFMWEVNEHSRCVKVADAAPACYETDAYQRLGNSFSTPALGTLFVERNASLEERGVAIFGGGEAIAGGAEVGLSVYVVDLETGEVLREFCNDCGNVEDNNIAGANKNPIDCGMIGPVAVYDSFIGGLITRAFLGDACGQLWRLDLASPDPDKWKLVFFHDAFDGIGLKNPHRTAITLRPALATSIQRGRLTVVYGSGDPEEPAKPGWPDRVFSLNEYWNGEAFEARVNWKLIFEEGESLTSVPTVFAEVAYFTSEVAGSGFCETGDGRLWGVKFDDTNASDADVIGKLDLDGCPITTDDIGKFLELPDSDVFGVQLVQRPTCFENPGNYTPWTGVTTGATVPPIGAGYPGVAQASPGPTFSGSSQGGIELVVQTGETGMSSPEMTPPAGGGQVQTGNKVVQKVPQPPQTVFSSSWGMVFD